jgi:hypothetical protein
MDHIGIDVHKKESSPASGVTATNWPSRAPGRRLVLRRVELVDAKFLDEPLSEAELGLAHVGFLRIAVNDKIGIEPAEAT